ncbi:hypothetical protein CAL12_20300 [Bordetella genomosp. 8]|uniref:Uncharacterized protein n=1 Tax=Bordetella genomosp. 8 TaxID=1416806 RepID=A0A1W6YPJ9_9BORD|nr:HEPN domain-containing protein [Bordetella genomosp. 8]ARP82924.1 hypothetical protein CAL12_20300 [Bordetella genomosp. 8]
MAKRTFDLYAGVSGLDLAQDFFDLGDGVFLSRTYAHLMAPFVMAFKRPPEYDQPHPGPWKPLGGGFAFDIDAEIKIPAGLDSCYGTQTDVARMIGVLFRLGVHPALRLPAFASHSFSTMADRSEGESWLRPNEFQPRYFPLDSDSHQIGAAEAAWVAERWRTGLRLQKESAEFALAIEAIDGGQFVQKSALALISLWSALEALFSPSTSELKFRVSALVAAYLEPPGRSRHTVQRAIAKLYDKRSAAAHGKPKHQAEDLLETFNLLARVLRKILDDQAVPSKEELESALFGAGSTQAC